MVLRATGHPVCALVTSLSFFPSAILNLYNFPAPDPILVSPAPEQIQKQCRPTTPSIALHKCIHTVIPLSKLPAWRAGEVFWVPNPSPVSCRLVYLTSPFGWSSSPTQTPQHAIWSLLHFKNTTHTHTHTCNLSLFPLKYQVSLSQPPPSLLPITTKVLERDVNTF